MHSQRTSLVSVWLFWSSVDDACGTGVSNRLSESRFSTSCEWRTGAVKDNFDPRLLSILSATYKHKYHTKQANFYAFVKSMIIQTLIINVKNTRHSYLYQIQQAQWLIVPALYTELFSDKSSHRYSRIHDRRPRTPCLPHQNTIMWFVNYNFTTTSSSLELDPKIIW